jgi:uncharacterized protein
VRRFFVLCAVSVSLCFMLGLSAFAQTGDDTPASKEDVENYLQVMHSHEMMANMVNAMTKPMHQMAHEQCLKDKDQLPSDCEARMNQYMDSMMKEMPWDEIMDSMVPVYQKHFTKGDLEALTAFYSSPTGQKVLKEMPGIMADAMQSMMPVMQKSIDRMTGRMQDQIAQMKKQSANGPNAQPAKN